MQKLPIGIQFFDSLREGNFLYVDKTEQIYRLINTGTFVFLSRRGVLASRCWFPRCSISSRDIVRFSAGCGSKTRLTGSRARCW
ncbi:MAG: AAA family ATPase [Anaerolineae bacterium]|nr:AAA family ATPase [Anaerolineae bacterium]